MLDKVFCLILHYNQLADTTACLTALQKSDLPAETEIIVIDNGAKDLQSYFRRKFPTVEYLKSPGNSGFAAGNNQGIIRALKENASHVLIMNPDVTVPKKFLKTLIQSMKKLPNCGVIAPAHTEGSGIYGLGGHIDWRLLQFPHDNMTTLPRAPRRYELVTFACVLIRADVFMKVGLLDERYFLYLEDVDFCVSVGRAGYNLYLDPSVIVMHRTSSSYADPRKKILFSFNSAIIFIRKWYHFPGNILPLIHTLFFYPMEYYMWSLRLLKRSILERYAPTD